MKFGKEFTAQMVPEWQEAYMDYNSLKKILKDLLIFTHRNKPSSMVPTKAASLKRRVSLYRAFSGLTSHYRVSSPKNGSSNEDEVILTSAHQEEGGGHYRTTFLNSTEEGGEFELVFFRRLDDQFNKVIKFYKSKVEEAVAEAEDLTKQMNALIALRIKVHDPDLEGALSGNLDANSVLNPISRTTTIQGNSHMEVIPEVEMSTEPNAEDEENRSRHNNIKGFRPASLQVLDNVKIIVEPETPISTMKNILSSSKSDLSYKKKELKKAEQLMARAFTQFYHKLGLLRSYCFLNQLACSKIMKKYDKVTSRNASKAYLNMVDASYLGSSEEVNQLITRVESTFIKHFAHGNHRKGMNILRPKDKREKHRISFSLGFCSGCFLALVTALVVLVHARDILNNAEGPKYMENIFPLYSFFGFISLHLFVIAAAIYFWKRYRINYTFIFGLKKGEELGYREVLLLSSGLAVLTLCCVISNLDMEMEPRTKSYKALTELVPLGLLTLMLLVIFCPFNIIYLSTRFFLIQSFFHCLLAPLYKVTLADFFLADQFTSQVQALRNLEFYVCYYGWGDFLRRSNKCTESEVFESFYFVVAIVPYWIRLLQCLRRLFEEKDKMHAYNSVKFSIIIIAVAFKTCHDLKMGKVWTILAAISSGLATVFATYWDIVIDWGLLQRNSINPWLRDKLAIPNKNVYFLAIGLNMVLRLAWLQSVLGYKAPNLHKTALTAIVASLEIVRRGIWNFFRLENEHLNNVGKYRAFKSVPLPFYYDDDEDDDADKIL